VTGLPRETRRFLHDLAAHNEKPWFEAHRDTYETAYRGAGAERVEALGPELRKISQNVQFDPRINGSISRINRDTRFAKDKSPYKDHLDLWFWHGGARGWDCVGFYMRITPDEVMMGVGMHKMGPEMLARYRAAVVDDNTGPALVVSVGQTESAGYRVGGSSRKRVPQGFDPAHPRAALLLHDGLYAGITLPGADAEKPDFSDTALGHFRACWPVGQWLMDNVMDL
jgi:uncharacterized protein (TIGR02453 family)